MTRTPSRFRKALAGGLAAVALSGAFVATGVTPASAACVTTTRSTNGNDPNRNFTISSASTCNDLNIREATVAQNYRGSYLSGSTWFNGSSGWKFRSPTTTSLAVVIPNIANGTVVRMTGASVNASANAVH